MAGFSDIEQRLCLGARAVERQRPDPQGADVRPHRRAGQPRRGRQGLLVVPRRRAEPRVEPVALPLSAERVPVRRPRRGERAARQARPRVRTARHRRVRRRPLLGGRGRLREGRRRRHRDGRSRATNAGPDAETLHVLPTAWFRNTWSWEIDARQADARDGATTASSRSIIRSSDRWSSSPCPGPTAPIPSRCSATTRRTTAACSARRRARPPEGRHQRPRRRRRADRQSGRRRARRSSLWYRLDVAAGATAEVRLRLRDRASDRRRTIDVDAVDRAAPCARPTSSTPR